MNESFGQRLLRVRPTAGQTLEQAEGRAEVFAALDALTGRILERSLAGQRVGAMVDTNGNSQFNLLAITEDERSYIRKNFVLGDQEKRGAWFLPRQSSINLGSANLPYHFHRYARFASGAAHDEALAVDLVNAPEALYFWSVLEPLCETLFRPITLRTTRPLSGKREEQVKAWHEVDANFANLGIVVEDSLTVFRFGGGWSKLGSKEQVEAKAKLLQSLASVATAKTAVAFRVLRTQLLAGRYYERARRGSPTMRRVLTKAFERTLSAYFGGDWLAFLQYIGEQPQPEERIAKALPEPKLYVTATGQTAAVAQKHGIAPSEVEKILAAYWGSGQGASPVEQRVSVLKRYWQQFDGIHSKQASGMPSLWGLVEENQHISFDGADKSVRKK